MNAETAGSGADIPTLESNVEGQTSTEKSEVQPSPGASHREAATEESSASEIASSDRLRAILEDEGLPEEEVESLTKPKGKTDAKKTETPGSDKAREGAGDHTSAKGAEKSEDGSQKSEVSGEPKGKAAGKDEDDETPLTEEQKNAAPWALPRIHKAVAQRNQARDEAKQLREQLQRVSQAQRPVPTAEDPLGDVATPEEMQSAIAEYESLLEWAETNPDGLSEVVIGKNADGTPKTRDYSAQEMATIRARAGRILRQEVPRRVALLREQGLHEQVAKERLPEMFEEGTDAHAFYQNALRDLPGLRSLPGMANMTRWAWMGRSLDIKASEDGSASAKATADSSWKKTVDPKIAPFLQKHPPMAPGTPEARVQSGNGAGRGGGDGKGGDEKVTQAKQRVEAGEGEEAEVDYIDSLRESQAPRKKGAVLV